MRNQLARETTSQTASASITTQSQVPKRCVHQNTCREINTRNLFGTILYRAERNLFGIIRSSMSRCVSHTQIFFVSSSVSTFKAVLSGRSDPIRAFLYMKPNNFRGNLTNAFVSSVYTILLGYFYPINIFLTVGMKLFRVT